MTKLTVAFCNFAKAPKNSYVDKRYLKILEDYTIFSQAEICDSCLKAYYNR